jgi:lysophospholipase L1-like esterase
MGYAPTVALYHGYRSVGLATLPALRWEGQITLMDRQDDIPDALDAPWRILCPYGAETTLKAFSLSDRAELLPLQTERKVRWLAHGDSITQGAHALHPGLTYVHLVADELGWEGLNLGFGGSAWGDAAVAEYIAARRDWDILSIAIGTNSYGGSRESAAAFGARYEEFLNIVRAAHPQEPILCLSPLWRRQDGPPETPNRLGDVPRAYREAVHQVVLRRNHRDPRLVLLDGVQLVASARGLTVDQLHPDAHGMIRIAQQVAPALWGLHNP